VTVVSGVVTVAVVPVGVVMVTAVIGVLTVTVAATVAEAVGIGSVGRETVGTRSSDGDSDGAGASTVDERTDAREPCVDAGPAFTLKPSVVTE
jgi:hypothetical protein